MKVESIFHGKYRKKIKVGSGLEKQALASFQLLERNIGCIRFARRKLTSQKGDTNTL